MTCPHICRVHSLLPLTVTPDTSRHFDHAVPRMFTLYDSQHSTHALKREGPDQAYVSLNPDRPITCQLRDLVMEHRTPLAITAFIITTIGKRCAQGMLQDYVHG